MIVIIHGDDLVSSREYFISEKGKIKNPIYFDKSITKNDLVQVVDGKTLFFETNDIFIENFFLNKKSNKNEYNEIIDYINLKAKEHNFIFWEEKPLEKSVLALFKNLIQKKFSLPQSLFLFLDSIKPDNINNLKLFHDAIKTIDEERLFYMIIRQFRLLLSVANLTDNPIDEVKRLAPWQKGKLLRQAKFFSKDKLLDIYNELFEIDLAQKSGGLGKTLTQSIDILLSKI